MAHSLILGMTESGKTTLAKKLAAHYKANGIGVLVLDPLSDPEWQADYKTSNPDDFLRVFWESRQCAVFIDEAGESVGRFDDAMIRTATKGRHWGHACHYISQRGAMLSKTVRGQCRHLFMFCMALDDGKEMAKEYNCPELMQCVNLEQGGYYHIARFGTLTRSNIFQEK